MNKLIEVCHVLLDASYLVRNFFKNLIPLAVTSV